MPHIHLRKLFILIDLLMLLFASNNMPHILRKDREFFLYLWKLSEIYRSMKFIASSTQLLIGLNSVSKVISSKPALAILDNYLFDLKGNTLSVTASNGETTLRTDITITHPRQTLKS